MEESKNNPTDSKEGMMLAMMDDSSTASEALTPTSSILTLSDVKRLKMLATSTDEGNKTLLFAYLEEVTYKGNEIALLVFFKKCQHYISTVDFEKHCPKFVKFISSFKIDNFTKNKIIAFDDISKVYRTPKSNFDNPENYKIYMEGYAEWGEEITLLTIPESKQETVDVTITVTEALPVNFVMPTTFPAYPKKGSLQAKDVEDLIFISKYISNKSQFGDFAKHLDSYASVSGNEVALAIIHKQLMQNNKEELTKEGAFNDPNFKLFTVSQQDFESAAPLSHKKLMDMNIENYSKSKLFVYRDLIYHYEKQSKNEKQWELLRTFYAKYIETVICKHFTLGKVDAKVVIS